MFWREKELSADVVVRPDGMISLPLINDVRAEGLTPDQLRAALTTAAAKFVEEPTVTVVVKAIQQPQGVHHRPGRQARSLFAQRPR